MDGSKEINKDVKSLNEGQPTTQTKSSSLYDWTLGLMSGFFPFRSSEPTVPPTISEEPDSSVEKVFNGQEEDDPPSSNPVYSDEESTEPESAIDIKQLIEESRTDSEAEEPDQMEEEEPPLIQFPSGDNDSLKMKRMTRVRSSELLKPPARYRSSHFKHPDRKRSIRFEDIAVLLDAASEGDLDEVRRLLDEEKVDVNLRNQKGVTALHRAAGHGQTDVMDFILSRKARVNPTDINNWTPLHNAASAGSLQALKMLIEHGANVEAETDAGETPAELTEIPEIQRQLRNAISAKLSAPQVTGMYDFEPGSEDNDKLPFNEGDVLQIKNRNDPDWWLAELNGREGYIPRGWVQ